MSGQLTHTTIPPGGPPGVGFQRQQMIVGPGPPQVSGLTSLLGPNQPPPPPTTQQQQQQNGYITQSYFPPTSPGMGGDFSQSPPSGNKFRSGLSSALRNHDFETETGYNKSGASSYTVLGPLDAPFPASVDLSNNQIARHGPFAASVPTKFGIMSSGVSSMAGSVRERVVTGDYPGSGTQSPVHGGEYGSRYGSPIESLPWGTGTTTTQHESLRGGGNFLLHSIQQQRNNNHPPPTSPLHSRPQSSSSPYAPHFIDKPLQQQQPQPQPATRISQLNRSRGVGVPPISSSVPAAHFGERPPFSPTTLDDSSEETLYPDALPSSLHDEVLLPQELNRRSSTSHTPGLNRRSSAYDDFARSPPASGAVTPGSGAGSLGGSPGSSRMEPIWAKIADDQARSVGKDGTEYPDLTGLSLNSRQRIASPLRHPLEHSPQYGRTSVGVAPSTLKTPSVHAAQKWGGRTADKLFPHQQVNGGESHAVNVPGVAWRRTGEVIGTGRGELTKEEVRRIKEEEELDTPFSME